jgi:hypothetical protein
VTGNALGDGLCSILGVGEVVGVEVGAEYPIKVDNPLPNAPMFA